MRIRVVLLAGVLLLAAAGCGGQSRARAERVEAARSGEPPGEPRRAEPRPPPPGRIDCGLADCVSLTFDDGPGKHTERLLDILKAAHVRATFFVLGEMVEERPQVVRRMVLEGHEVANHSWSHRDLTGLSPAGVRSQIRRTQQAVKRASGVEPTLMRPPYGATDAKVARAAGMPQILWSVDTLDWRHRDADRGAKVGISEPGRGGIVLYHDIHKPTVDCIPRVIRGLKKRGFTLVTVGELFQGERLEPGETYTERDGGTGRLSASPTPPGSRAGAPDGSREPSGRGTAPRAR
ncbi:MAG: polysaccharide deacetylase family protein [Actinomadura sp.]